MERRNAEKDCRVTISEQQQRTEVRIESEQESSESIRITKKSYSSKMVTSGLEIIQ